MKYLKVFLNTLLVLLLAISLFGCGGGLSESDIATPNLGSVAYDPNQTLADIVLPSGWTWNREETVPVVDVSDYPATYSADGLKFQRDIPLTVEKAVPKTPAPQPVEYSPTKALRDVKLSDGWTWIAPGIIPTVSVKEYPAKYTPTDNNYLAVENCMVPLTVHPADPATPDQIEAYPEEDEFLKDLRLPEGWNWKEPETKLDTTPGVKSYEAVYSDEDGNYNAKTANIKVNMHEPQVTVSTVTISFVDDAERIGTGMQYPEPLGTILEETSLIIREGDTVADITVRALENVGFTHTSGETDLGFYLAGIGGFTTEYGVWIDYIGGETGSDFYCGWTYYINGDYADDSASSIRVKDGDIIEWKFAYYPHNGSGYAFSGDAVFS